MTQSNISLKSSVSQFVIVLVVIIGFGVLLSLRDVLDAPVVFVIGLICGVILSDSISNIAKTCSGCEESTGETKLWCCNHCGKRMEKFFGGELE